MIIYIYMYMCIHIYIYISRRPDLENNVAASFLLEVP